MSRVIAKKSSVSGVLTVFWRKKIRTAPFKGNFPAKAHANPAAKGLEGGCLEVPRSFLNFLLRFSKKVLTSRRKNGIIEQ